MIEKLVIPSAKFGDQPVVDRDSFLLRSLTEAVSNLNDRLGSEMSDWEYGQKDYKHALIRHPLSPAVDEDLQQQLNVGPAPRGGNSYTINSGGSSDNQTFGASFRIIVDTGNWDRTVGMNNPGQSGNPKSPYYDNLFELWANDKFFPVYFSREKVESVAKDVIEMGTSR